MSSPGNTKHQAAVLEADDLVDQLQGQVREQLEVVRELATKLEDLADTRQSVGLGFLTEDARTARDKQVKADRDAARGGTLESLGPVATRVRWARSTTVLGTGQVAAPVTVTAVSAAGEILFALQHQLRRLARPAAIAAAAAVPGSHGRLPLGLPVTDTDVNGLVDQLLDLVNLYSNRPGLQSMLRDLEHLEETAREVIEGPARTNHPDPCPWCGRRSLAIYGVSRKVPGRDAIFVRCEGQHPCVCEDPWCPCKRNPVKHRHEWVNSGHAKNRVDGRDRHSLSSLIARNKEIALLEPRALEALERIREMHQPTWTDPEGVTHTWYVTVYEPPADHVCVIDGLDRCDPESGEHVVPACLECRRVTDAGDVDGYLLWPCPTYRAADLTDPDVAVGDSATPKE